jgi:hypothetical protein
MPQHLSDDIRECGALADKFKHKARIERDPVRRRDYLDSEKRWRTLARGYELAQRLNHLANSELPAGSSKNAA